MGDDGRLMIWDLRSDDKPQHSVIAHEKEVNITTSEPKEKNSFLVFGFPFHEKKNNLKLLVV